MKKLLSLFLITSTISLTAQVWTQKADFPGLERFATASFSIDSLGYLCLGSSNSQYFTDLWQYNPSTDTWSAKTNFPGIARRVPVYFVIDSIAYVGLGYNHGSAATYSDFYSYNPNQNTWLSRANFPGTARRNCKAASINGKGYVFGGGVASGNLRTQQVWEYDPTLDTWTQKTNFPFAARTGGVAFAIDSLIYFGLGHNLSTDFQDIWAYNPALDSWTQKSLFPGIGRLHPNSVVINGKAIVGGGVTLNHTYPSDYYIYDPVTDIWTSLPGFADGAKDLSATFVINDKGYLAVGRDSTQTAIRNVWQYTDTTILTGIKTVRDTYNSLLVYPNPTNGMIKFSDLKSQFTSINVYDSKGKLVVSNNVTLSGNDYEIDLSAMKNGTYFYQLVGLDSEKATGKILLNK